MVLFKYHTYFPYNEFQIISNDSYFLNQSIVAMKLKISKNYELSKPKKYDNKENKTKEVIKNVKLFKLLRR